jgi:hypothetical protein
MTTALEGCKWSSSRPGRSLPPGKTRCPLFRRLGGFQGRSGQVHRDFFWSLYFIVPYIDRTSCFKWQPQMHTSHPVTLTAHCPFYVLAHSSWVALVIIDIHFVIGCFIVYCEPRMHFVILSHLVVMYEILIPFQILENSSPLVENSNFSTYITSVVKKIFVLLFTPLFGISCCFWGLCCLMVLRVTFLSVGPFGTSCCLYSALTRLLSPCSLVFLCYSSTTHFNISTREIQMKTLKVQ